MLTDGFIVPPKQCCQLLTGQPHSLILQTDIDLCLSVLRLIDYYFLIFFHNTLKSITKIRLSEDNTKYFEIF